VRLERTKFTLAHMLSKVIDITRAPRLAFNIVDVRNSEPKKRYRITLEGVVQGVGFRPFVKKLADRSGLHGVSFNTTGGLVVEIETDDARSARFFREALETQAPPAARINALAIEECPELIGYDDFRILASAARNQQFTLIPADLATCSECLREIQSPDNRRFQYPFTNCTNCGPRYSITRSTPYDRCNTTMARFSMCTRCAREYCDSADRRFHAEPIACPVCGPRLDLDLSEVVRALEQGRIVALKGLGGYQLACDAFRSEAVDELRRRKRRSRKPFAIMARNIATLEAQCLLTAAEKEVLLSPAAPVVLLKMLDGHGLSSGVAPGLRHLGAMLPYTPLHHSLFAGSLQCLVMTSGNISEEPIVTQNQAALKKLAPIADVVVGHNRDIFMRVDDSVTRVFEGTSRILRRARGYAPEAISLGRNVGEVLAVGAELKNTFCLTKGSFAVVSQHIGDLENYETLQFFEETLNNLQSVYRCKPRLIAHDLHPSALSTRWAQARPEPKIAVQHHHAHLASCMAENGLDREVIGVAFDGTGWGPDGQIWGGEFLVCDYKTYTRWAHLRYVTLPGGDQAIRQPWRMAAAHLYDALGPDYRKLELPCWQAAPPGTWKILEHLIQRPTLRTSSCGRLFDAVSSMCGISQASSYEGEPAMLLEEAAIAADHHPYPLTIVTDEFPWTIDTRTMISLIAHEIASGESASRVSHCFHESIARMIEEACSRIRGVNSVDIVCLSGGAFQNLTLLARSCELLHQSGFQVFLHSKVPPNDGGLSLGQAAIAANYLESA
jgi:hydrogenase maturation protein HypF